MGYNGIALNKYILEIFGKICMQWIQSTKGSSSELEEIRSACGHYC